MNRQIIELPSGQARLARGRPRDFVAFVRSAERRTDPSGREIAIDVALAAAATVALLITIIYTVKVPASCTSDGPLAPGGACLSPPPAMQGIGWHAALPMTAAAWPLALRRFRPLTAFWLSLAGALVIAVRPDAVVTFVPVVAAAYSAAAHSPYRRAAMLSVTAGGALAAVFLPAPPAHHMSSVIERAAALLTPIPLLVVGNAMRRWQRRAGDSRAQLLRVQAEHQEATAHAIGQERARIAGELHDVVTHSVSMMVVQAGAARRVLSAAPDEARSALLAIEESGRAAIVELQHLLGLLAPQDGMRDSAVNAEPLRPQPGLDQVRPLIDRVAAGGLPVKLSVRGEPRPLPPGIDLAAYRVIQEALTNVIKHAGQPRTTVTLDFRPGEVLVEVTDDGHGGADNAGDHPAASRGPGLTSGSGRGLLGLRERVLLYGGELDAGYRSGGGWRVSARIVDEPLLAAASAPSPAPS